MSTDALTVAIVQQALDRCDWADDGAGENEPSVSSLLYWLKALAAATPPASAERDR